MKSIEVFATDDAGSVGNKVIYTFNYDPATQLQFASTGEPPATGLPGVNFAAPLPVVVDAEDAAGNIATTYSGPVTISLVSGSGLTGTLTVNAVAGVATFSNLAIANDGTYHLLAMSPTLATTNPPSTSILIVGPASQLAFVQEPPGSVRSRESIRFRGRGRRLVWNSDAAVHGQCHGRDGCQRRRVEPERGCSNGGGCGRGCRLHRFDAQQGRPGLHAQGLEHRPYRARNHND